MGKFYKMAKCVFSWPTHFKSGQNVSWPLWQSCYLGYKLLKQKSACKHLDSLFCFS